MNWQARKVALSDPDYIAAEARRRLQYVTPGDTVFVVHAPALAPSADEDGRGGRALGPALVRQSLGHPVRGRQPVTVPFPNTVRQPHPGRPHWWESVTDNDRELLTRELGRPPRGLLAVAYRCDHGVPAVVQTSPRLPDGTPSRRCSTCVVRR